MEKEITNKKFLGNAVFGNGVVSFGETETCDDVISDYSPCEIV